MYQEIPIGQVKPSPLNPRKRFDQVKLEELAATFAPPVGIIEPLVVRTNGEVGTYEVVAGERRLKAAQIAKLETVPVLVRELTDAQVLEIMVIENDQREDINALEEGEGYAALLKTGYDLDKLAVRLGRSKKYVYDRMKLRDLVPTAKQLLLEDRMSPGQAIEVARLTPEHQARALDPHHGGIFQHETTGGEELDDEKDPYAGLKARTVRETRYWIANHVRLDLADAVAAAPLEFGETAAAAQAAAAKPGRGKKIIPITFDYVAPAATRADERTYGSSTWAFADGKAHREGWKTAVGARCEHAVLGVVVAGDEEYGKAFEVCIARDRCQVHWKKEIAERERNAKLRASGQAKKAERREANGYAARQERWKREQVERERRVTAWEKIRPRALDAAAVTLKKAGANGRVIETLMSSVRIYDKTDRELVVKHFGKVTAQNVAVALLFAHIVDDNSRAFDEFQKVAKTFDVDVKALEAEYRAALVPPAAAPKKAAAPAVKKKAKAVQTSARKKKR